MTSGAAEPEAAESEAAESEGAGPEAAELDVDAKQGDQSSKDQHVNDDEAADVDEQADTEQSVERFRREAQRLLAHSANVLGRADVTGDLVGGNKFVTIHSASNLPQRVTSGQMPAAQLASVLERFAKAPDHDELVHRLRTNRVLVLRGPRASGRRTASLGVLADVKQDPQPLLVLDPAIPPGELVDQLRPGARHLIADFSTTTDAPLRQYHLHAIQERLRASDGFAIITIDPHVAVDGTLAEMHEWHPPAPESILNAHLEADCPHPSVRQPALDLDETRSYLKTQPSPEEIAGYARTLLLYVDGQRSLQDLATYSTSAVEDYAQRVFSDTDGSMREKAFLIALAVFNQLPYSTIAEAGDALYRAFQEREDPETEAGVSIFDTSRSARLTWARALEYDSFETDQDRDSTRLAAFLNPSMSSIVLRHVWLEHPAAREPIRRWLRELGESGADVSRVRAALAAGRLAAADFSSIMRPLLEPWAGSRPLGQRQLAAWTLFAALQQGADDEVRRVLQRWAEGGEGRRWTVLHTADALADMLGKSTIPLISAIAEKPARDPRLRNELERVTARLLTGPTALQALDTMVGWLQNPGPRRELAYRAFVRAAGKREEGRPALLSHGNADQQAWTALIILWRAVLNNPTVRDDARLGLAGWVILAAEDKSLEPDLCRLFSELAGSANERARLDYLLRHLPREAPEAARPVADRIRTHLVDK
ncbi:hypothetical protein OH802_27400 [Nocardioides sp. NBC_00850]|uniref:hypothetical protein n=1 Tax=Nocardioides sp. NBC_00850 TaxID=2976001 RepID=UPI00386F8261|nr:hypothetical protein OH802_27400 [Nocardioides sp. NBC_00850]